MKLSVLFAGLVAFTFSAGSAWSAEAFRVTAETRAALPAGKEADGMIGDYILRNDRVVAVIGDTAAGRDANQMVEAVQGAVLDFTTLDAPNDLLVVVYPMGLRPKESPEGRTEIIKNHGTSVSLRSTRLPNKKEPWTATTTYTLNDGETFLHIETVHKNTSKETVRVPLQDRLRLDNDDVSPQSPGAQSVVLIENRWWGGAYGLVNLDGPTLAKPAAPGPRSLRDIGVEVTYPKNEKPALTADLKPGDRLVLQRALVLGRDAATVQIAAATLLRQSASAVIMRLQEKNGEPVASAFVDVKSESGYVTSATSDENGTVTLPLVDGRYELTVWQPGRANVSQKIEVANTRLATDDALTLPARSKLKLDVAEAGTGARMPVKIELRSANGPHPWLGPMKRALGSANLIFSANGQEEVAVPPGNYVAHVSRGPEYSVELVPVEIKAGESVTLHARLRREFDTPGWITADLHNHSTSSGDTNVELSGRVLNLAGSGIEFAPATEHNRISSYTPVIEKLGLSNFIASAAGIELSGRPGPGQINHQNAFPLEIRPEKQGYGAPKTDENPFVQLKRLYDLGDKRKLLQQNHPDISWLYYDKDADGQPDGGFGTKPFTDVMEIRETMLSVLEDTAPGALKPTSRVFHWLQMLNQGDRIFGTANTDAHTVGHENGSIFNYIRVTRDTPATLDAWEIADQVKHGHVILSNGPFLDVTLGQAIPGDEIVVRGGEVTLNVTVKVGSWTDIDRVQVLVNGRQEPAANFTRASHPQFFTKGPVVFDRAISLHLPKDAHVIVVATGEHATIDQRLGGKFIGIRPMAMSNPIFVDVDGRGFTPSKDTLGWPLPTGKGKGSVD